MNKIGEPWVMGMRSKFDTLYRDDNYQQVTKYRTLFQERTHVSTLFSETERRSASEWTYLYKHSSQDPEQIELESRNLAELLRAAGAYTGE